ncbi:hypothetical protein BD779DRAFT_1577905, partial [Infundibulicybe gibba]
MVDQLEILHKEYGCVVRIGPNDLRFDDPEAYEVIYSTASKFTKDPHLVVLAYTNPQLAKIRKDIIRPLFSRCAILNLEPIVQNAVHTGLNIKPLDITSVMGEQTRESAPCVRGTLESCQHPRGISFNVNGGDDITLLRPIF